MLRLHRFPFFPQTFLFALYAITPLYTVFCICLVTANADTSIIVTKTFNLAGWVIAVTGITDCLQTLWVIRVASATTFAKTNLRFAIGMLAVYVVGIILFTVLYVFEAPLVVYRAISLTFLTLEMGLFVPILWKTRSLKGFRGQAIYYARYVAISNQIH